MTTQFVRVMVVILTCALHEGHHFFQPLPSGRRYRSFRAKTNRLANSLYPHRVRLLMDNLPTTPYPLIDIMLLSITVTWTLHCWRKHSNKHNFLLSISIIAY